MNFYQFSRKLCFVLIGILLVTKVGLAENDTIPNDTIAPSNRVEITTTAPNISPEINQTTKPAGRLWNLQDADILSVINEVSQETGKNFVVDPRVNGKISLISSKPLRKGEVYQVFLTVLGMLGYSAIPSGNVIKIVPNMESGEQTTPVASRRSPGQGEEVVVRVIPLENVSATQLIPILRPLLPQWSNISAYAPGNVLVLLGRASNLERIFRVIQDVDRASTSGIQMIQLHRANAAQIAVVLNNLQNAARATGEAPGVSIAVDERSNSILIGGPKAMRLKMRVLLAQLDAPAASTSGNTEVVYLRYQEAKTLAPILGKITQNILGKDTGAQYDSTAITSGPGSTTTTATSAKNVPINSSNIQAEPSTNSIIITAPPMLMQAIKTVIAKLDIRPAEVQVEAIIAEVSESDLRSLGIQWGARVGNGAPPANPEGSTITSFPSLGAGVFGIIPSTPIRAVLSLLENMTGVDILSTPSIVVLDNQKASIEVGQDVPFQTGSYTTPNSSNTATTVQPFNTFQSKPVTLKLDVTPQINLSNSVRLKIKLKKDTLQNPQNPGTTPIINTNKIENSVLIKSEDILVIGGLKDNSNNESINKVPILGDVPIIGPLFQQKTRTVSKKNLVVFIKPVIIHTNDDAMLLSHAKYNYVRRRQANFREDLRDIGKEPAKTLLPPWKNNIDLPRPFDMKDKCPDGSCLQPPPNMGEEDDP